MKVKIECRECKQIVDTDERGQVYCSRHCARIAQARLGVPSDEDRKARFLDRAAALFDEFLKPK
jgi:hypothetical protein